MTLVGEGTGLPSTITHGTGTIHTKEFVVDMRDKIYRLDPAQNPFLVFSNMFPKVTAYNYKYEWMEREGFARRTFVGTWVNVATATPHNVLGVKLNARDWNAIAFISSDVTTEANADNMVRICVAVKDAGTAGDTFVGHIKRSAYINGHQKRKLYDIAGAASPLYYDNTIQLSKKCNAVTGAVQGATPATYEADVIIDSSVYAGGAVAEFTWDGAGGLPTNGDPCFVTVEYPNMQKKGYRQGSGLGKEQKKISNWYYNYTQIFKTPVSVTGTMQACRTIGGDERMKRQFENGQSHASDLEYALLFQGGGVEGVDWGIVENYENPTTRFKGLGVGHRADKEGWIVTNNGNPFKAGAASGKDCQITAGDMDDYIKFMERLYDDMKNGSPNKTMFTSTTFIKDMTSIAQVKNTAGFFQWMGTPAYAGTIGLNIQRIQTPFGTLDMVLHPMFTGPYRRYGLILDMKNVAIRPLNGRDTKLHVNVSSGEIDGIVDEYRTELGLELRNEGTHAIAYLDGSV
jgi:hypothetical protein